MPSRGMVYTSCLHDAMSGLIDFADDQFGVMLMRPQYQFDKTGHAKRSDIGAQEVKGVGYEAGGKPVDVQITNDGAVVIWFDVGTWDKVSVMAGGAVYYKRRGGEAASDELVAYVSFGQDVISTNGSFEVGQSSIRMQN